MATEVPPTPTLPRKGGGESMPPKSLGLALAVIAVAQLMVVLDTAIVNIALPSIQRALHFTPTGLEWVVNGYALAFGGLLLLGGRAGDLFGRRRVFVAGVILFTLGSLAGGFATTSTWLITKSRAGCLFRGVRSRRRRRFAPGRADHELLLLALGPVRKRPDRHRARARRATGAGGHRRPAGAA